MATGAIEASIAGFVDFAHAAPADRIDHFEVTQLVAGRKWHEWHSRDKNPGLFPSREKRL